jgi:hypothetical protein
MDKEQVLKVWESLHGLYFNYVEFCQVLWLQGFHSVNQWLQLFGGKK